MSPTGSPLSPTDWRHATSVVSHVDGGHFEVLRDGGTLLVRDTHAATPVRFTLRPDAGQPSLVPSAGRRPTTSEWLAALEASFTFCPDTPSLQVEDTGAGTAELTASGAVRREHGAQWAHRDMLWQLPRLFVPAPREPIALRYTLTDGRRHPVRAPAAEGVLYRRHIPWLGRSFSFRALEIDRDLPLVHRWMNDPEVARIWQEAGPEAKHRAYLEGIAADPHMHAMIASLDDQPIGYFEVYWAKENRIAPFYDVHDHDRGWHVLIGEPAFRGKAIATAWLTSITHYLFLDDPRTQRAVGEPRADHAQQVRNLDKSGYAKVKEFDFPHKRALLVTLLRERYFADTLWWPRRDEPVPSSSASPEGRKT